MSNVLPWVPALPGLTPNKPIPTSGVTLAPIVAAGAYWMGYKIPDAGTTLDNVNNNTLKNATVTGDNAPIDKFNTGFSKLATNLIGNIGLVVLGLILIYVLLTGESPNPVQIASKIRGTSS